MKTVLYMNNDKIRIISVKRKRERHFIRKQINRELEPGSIVNGVIINKESVLAELIPYRKKLRNAIVVINSSNIFVKKLDFPNLTKKQLHIVIKSEFYLTDESTVLYDKNIYNEKGVNTTVCCSAPVELVGNYAQLFKEAKIKPKKIDIAQNAVIKLIKTKPGLKSKTFVLNVIEGNNLVSFLFDKGEYVLTNRSGILEDKDTEEYIHQLYTKLSSVIQFNRSEKSENEIEKSYYVGLSEGEIVRLQEYTEEQGSAAAIESFEAIVPSDFLKDDCFYPYAGTHESKDDMNLLNVYNEWRKQSAQKNKKLKTSVLVYLLVLFLVFGSFFHFKLSNYILGMENRRISEYIGGEGINKRIQDVLQQIKMTREADATLTEVQDVNKTSKKTKGINGAKLQRVLLEAQKSVVIESIEYDSNRNEMTIIGFGQNEGSSSLFIANLKSTQLFQNVEYSGYALNNINEYTFRVVCTFHG